MATFLDRVEIDSSWNATVYSYQTFALQIQNIDLSSFKGETFNVDLGSVERAMNNTGGIDDSALITVKNIMESLNNATAAIYISEELLEYCFKKNGSRAQRLSYSVFLFDTFFRSQNPTNQPASLIIGARVTCSVNETLPMGVRATFRSRNNVRKTSIKYSSHNNYH